MPTEKRLEKINRAVKNRQKNIKIILEDLYDPLNASAVFRTCDAFGIQDVEIIFIHQDPFDPKTIGKKTSSSANKWLDFSVYHSTEECITNLQKDGYEVWATALTEKSESVFEADFTAEKIAFMFGNEHRGLSEEAVKLADKTLLIPMAGLVQSLNLSVTAAICMFEVTRQRKNAGMEKYVLSSSEAEALCEDWCERKKTYHRY